MTNLTQISNSALLAELVTRGFLTQSQSDSSAAKHARAEAKAVKTRVIETIKRDILEAVASGTDRVYSVKKTSNSIGIIDLPMSVQVDRGQILKALTQLTCNGSFRKVGLVGGVEKLPSEVNSFQIRYIYGRVTEVADEADAETGE